MAQLRVGHSVYRIERQRLENPLFLCQNGVSLSTFARRLRWNIRAEGFFGHIVAGCGVCPGPASAAELSVSAHAALAFKTFAVAHPRQVLALMPYIGKPAGAWAGKPAGAWAGKPAGAWAGKPRFEDAAAIDRQIPARKDIPLMAHEQHSQTSQTPLRRAERASTGDGV